MPLTATALSIQGEKLPGRGYGGGVEAGAVCGGARTTISMITEPAIRYPLFDGTGVGFLLLDDLMGVVGRGDSGFDGCIDLLIESSGLPELDQIYSLDVHERFVQVPNLPLECLANVFPDVVAISYREGRVDTN